MRKSLIIFGVVLLAILVLYIKYCDRSYSNLPKLSEKYLVIEKEDGIKDFCKVGQSIDSAITSLGRPSLYSEDWDNIPRVIDVEYEDYGLSLFGSYDDWYRFKPVKPKLFKSMILHKISIKITEKNRDKIRLYNERKIDYPLNADAVYKLYGEPQIIVNKATGDDFGRLLRKEKSLLINYEMGSLGLLYHFDKSYVYFWGKNKIITVIIITHK